ncbi:Uncharacterised protein [Mycobacteroides abscessus subsp. abscessus]|nr:Uncharacterised protein [Mycobacteroides abscessus subsp. abscessus]
MPIPGIKCLPDNGFRFCVGDGGDTEAQLGDVDTVMEANCGDSAWMHDGLQSLCG